MMPAAVIGIQAICTAQTVAPMAPNSSQVDDQHQRPRPATSSGCRGCARSSRPACRGRTCPAFPGSSTSARYSSLPVSSTVLMPRVTAGCAGLLRFRTWRGACGGWRPIPWSPCRWSATARSGRSATGIGCRSSARCACARCRKIVTDGDRDVRQHQREQHAPATSVRLEQAVGQPVDQASSHSHQVHSSRTFITANMRRDRQL